MALSGGNGICVHRARQIREYGRLRRTVQQQTVGAIDILLFCYVPLLASLVVSVVMVVVSVVWAAAVVFSRHPVPLFLSRARAARDTGERTLAGAAAAEARHDAPSLLLFTLPRNRHNLGWCCLQKRREEDGW